MLYDKRWGSKVKTKADPLTLEAFIAWLETHPADEMYCYSNSGECLNAQYHRFIGQTYTPPLSLSNRTFAEIAEDIAQDAYPRTFGAALELARETLAAQQRQQQRR